MEISLVLFVVIWGIIVFTLSNQDISESHKLSAKIIGAILEKKDKIDAVIHNYKVTKEINFSIEPTAEITAKRIYRLQLVTRKFAHYSLYAIGSFLIYMATTAIMKDKMKLRILITLLIGVIYAASDEFHQIFIRGRTPDVVDIGIDTLGVVTGILIGIFITWILNKLINCFYERRKSNG